MAKKAPTLPKLGYGQGTMVYREKSNTIQYQKMFKFTLKTGEQIKERIAVYGKTVNECFLKMEQAHQEVIRKIQEQENPILYDAMIDWLNKEKKPELKKTSFDTLHKTIRRIGEYEISKIRYNQVTKEDIENHIQELKDKNLSYSIVKKSYDALNAFYRYAVLNDMLEHSPVERVKVPTKKRIQATKGY